MKSDGIFFLGVLTFFFILWYATGGPTKPISFAGPYITPITDVDTVQQGYGDDVNTSWSSSFGSSWSGGNIWSSITNIESNIASLQRRSSDIRAFGEASPFEGLVTVSGTGGVYSEDEDLEYITLRASGNQAVDITGWRLVSGASGKSARIPEGASLPRSGRVNDTDRIVLNPGEEAIIVTGDSPKGVSFKENMCTGYFSESQTFYPALSLQCPYAYDEFDRFFTGNELKDDKCYERMRSTQTCRTPDDSNVSRACQNLIDDYLTYSGCVEKHQYDSRFAGKTWRIYLERSDELWKPSRDAIKLVDREGKTVDLYTY